MLPAHLEISQVAGRSVVTSSRACAPLQLLAPVNHGHAAWVYQSTLGGGLVGADRPSLRVSVEPGATLFLSSQASSKVYRAASARFSLDASIARGATLVCWPDPVVCFAGASLTQVQRFCLEPGAALLCVDALTAGRVESGERWAFERFTTRLTLERAGALLFNDAVVYSGDHGPLEARLGPAEALATVVLAGEGFADAARELAIIVSRQQLRPVAEAALVAASPQPWGLVLRILAPSAEALFQATQSLLRRTVAALLGDDPWARKW